MPTRQNTLASMTTNPQSALPLHLSLQITGTVTRGQPLQATLVASGGTGGYVYAGPTSGALPPGCGPADGVSGNIPGTPTAVGRYQFQATVQDSSATSVTATFVINVASTLTPRDVTPTPGEVSVPYSYPLRVNGATGAVTWALISGNLPAGDSLNASGLLGGTPTFAGAGFSYATVRATDSGSGDTLDVAITMQVFPQVAGPATIQRFDLVVGASLTANIGGSGGLPPYQFRQLNSANVWPSWMTLSPSGVLQVIDAENPNANGTPYGGTFAYQIRDALGGVSPAGFLLFVKNPQSILQPQKSGAPVGVLGPNALNFAGALVTDVTNDGLTATLTIGAASGAAHTGFTASSGTAAKGAFATYAAPTLGSAYNTTVQGQLNTALAHIQVLSQQIKALKDACLAQGVLKT